MGREHFVFETFVELADTLASDFDVGEFLHRLVLRCEEALAVDAGGVLLEDRDGSLRLAAATSSRMERYEELEIRTKEGPCIDAYRLVEQVVAEDLERELDRWPQAGPQALELGMRAVYAFPLRLRDDCIGALNLYRDEPGPFDDDDMRLAQAFADVAAIVILQARQVSDRDRTVDQLQHALDSRLVIEQAKGILIERYGVHPDQAFEALRTRARDSRRKIQQVARELISQRTPGAP